MIPRLYPARRGLIVAALGSSLTISWASSYYIPAVLAVPMAEDLGLSPVWVFGAFSMAMVVSALVGPWAGARIDGFGGRGVLMLSNLVFAAGLGLLAVAPSPLALFAGWAVIGLGMGIGLYEAGFATLAAQGVPTDDNGLTARDIIETGDREADLALQADKLAVRELIAEIEREQLETLQRILDAQTSFGGQGLPVMVSGLESGSGDPARSVEAVYGNADIDPNPGGAQMFGDAAENIEQLIIRVAQETSGFAGVTRAGLSPVQWRALLQALIWQESRFTIGARSPVGAYGLTQIMPGTASDLGINPEYYDSPYLQVHGGARYLAAQLNTFDGNIINALAAYNAGPGRVFEYGGVPPFRETQHYVTVIPERYNLYLSRIGGIDALGTIDPVLLANANLSLTGHGAAFYGNNSPAAIRQAALRIADIVERISETEDVQESIALNTYARAELVRLVAARVRLKAARTRVLSAEELALASARMAEGAFMEFTIREME